jgi:hypothetical protein
MIREDEDAAGFMQVENTVPVCNSTFSVCSSRFRVPIMCTDTHTVENGDIQLERISESVA